MQLVSLNLPFQWTRDYGPDKYDSEMQNQLLLNYQFLLRKCFCVCVSVGGGGGGGGSFIFFFLGTQKTKKEKINLI